MKLWEEQIKFTQDVAQLIQYIFEKGYFCTFGEAYRTPEQAEIYAKQNKGIKNSAHCRRLAIDLNIFSADREYLNETENYLKFGVFWENLDESNQWGGRFVRADGNHFERQES